MDSPVTNEACEQRRCDMRKLIRDEIRDVMTAFSDNRARVDEWLIRIENKMDTNNRTMLEVTQRVSDKQDEQTKLMLILIAAIAFGTAGIKLGWI